MHRDGDRHLLGSHEAPVDRARDEERIVEIRGNPFARVRRPGPDVEQVRERAAEIVAVAQPFAVLDRQRRSERHVDRHVQRRHPCVE